MQILKLAKNNKQQIINQAVKVLQNDGLVVFPSDTVYGLAVNPKSKKAVDKLFQIKSRNISRAVSVVMSDWSMVQDYVVINRQAISFNKNFLPGPFTLVLKIKKNIDFDRRIYSPKNTQAVRIPDYWLLTDIAFALRAPFTATSANISGKSPHYTASGFLKTLSKKRKDLIDLVIDAGKLPRRKPSAVVDLSEGEIRELRRGDISFGQKKVFSTAGAEQTRKLAQKLLKKYYSGRKTLIFALVGELGAGKTTFAKGIGDFFGIKNINSPTFLISKEYAFDSGFFHHIDAYRLDNARDLPEIGFKKMLKPKNIILIEWAGKVKQAVMDAKSKADIYWIFIEQKGKKVRSFHLRSSQ